MKNFWKVAFITMSLGILASCTGLTVANAFHQETVPPVVAADKVLPDGHITSTMCSTDILPGTQSVALAEIVSSFLADDALKGDAANNDYWVFAGDPGEMEAVMLAFGNSTRPEHLSDSVYDSTGWFLVTSKDGNPMAMLVGSMESGCTMFYSFGPERLFWDWGEHAGGDWLQVAISSSPETDYYNEDEEVEAEPSESSRDVPAIIPPPPSHAPNAFGWNGEYHV